MPLRKELIIIGLKNLAKNPMPKPTPGKQYTITDENTLSQVARRAYGNGNHWPRIWRANQSALRSGDPDLIFPGEVIFIPEIAELRRDAPDLSNREPDELSIIVDGLDITPTDTKIVLTMDTTSDAWTASIPWTPGENEDLDKRVIFYAKPLTRIYIGGKLVITGPLTDSESVVSDDGTVKNLGGYSRTVDMLDSNMKPPLEENNVTLKQRAQKLVQVHGIKAVFNADTGGPFDRVTIGDIEKIATHLNGLAKERAVLMSSTADGNLLFHEADTKSPPLATLQEGQPPVGNFRLGAKSRERFNSYRVLLTTPLDNFESIAIDKSVPGSRHKVLRIQGAIEGEAAVAARWARNLAWIKALTFKLPVEGWLDPNGNVWTPNTKYTFVSPSAHLADGFDFLVRAVEFNETPDGKSAILNLIPPQLYSKEEVVEPWV